MIIEDSIENRFDSSSVEYRSKSLSIFRGNFSPTMRCRENLKITEFSWGKKFDSYERSNQID